MLRLRALLVLAVLFASAAASLAEETDLARFDQVDIAPTKTSIYVGSVTMTMPTFVRTDGVYSAGYHAKVFPYFFYNESGTLFVEISDEQLRQLAAGAPIEFSGHGVSDDGDRRHIEGRAVPADATHGRIKVRVFVSKRIQLIFNTTYRFAAAAPDNAGARSGAHSAAQ